MKGLYKVVSLSLVFSLVLNISTSKVFASDVFKGNPVVGGSDYSRQVRSEILKGFKEAGEGQGKKDIPVDYIVKTKAKGNSDYREIRAYNMPFLAQMRTKLDDSLIYQFSVMLFEGKKAAMEASKKASMGAKVVSDTYRAIVQENLKKDGIAAGIADALGSTSDVIIEAFISFTDPTVTGTALFSVSGASFFAFLSSVGAMAPRWAAIAKGAIQLTAKSLLPTIALPIGFLVAATAAYATGVSKTAQKLAMDRTKNITLCLRTLLGLMSDDQGCPWRDNNVFITAIDHRKFSKFFIGNLYRENHCSWTGFMNLANLEHAPVVEKGDAIDMEMLKASIICRAFLLSDCKVDFDRLFQIYKCKSYEQIPHAPSNNAMLAYTNNYNDQEKNID